MLTHSQGKTIISSEEASNPGWSNIGQITVETGFTMRRVQIYKWLHFCATEEQGKPSTYEYMYSSLIRIRQLPPICFFQMTHNCLRSSGRVGKWLVGGWRWGRGGGADTLVQWVATPLALIGRGYYAYTNNQAFYTAGDTALLYSYPLPASYPFIFHLSSPPPQ